MYTIEKYTGQAREELINIFRLNVPKYFAAEEEKELDMYLDNHAQNFYLCMNGTQLAGCGGHNIKEDVGVLSWYIVHPDYQRGGVGSTLVRHNMDELRRKEFKKIKVRTSQHADKFYEKFGFKLVDVKKDYWAPGIDLYDMEL